MRPSYGDTPIEIEAVEFDIDSVKARNSLQNVRKLVSLLDVEAIVSANDINKRRCRTSDFA